LPYKPSDDQPEGCTVCSSRANILKTEFRIGTVVDCSRCGDYQFDHVVARDAALPLQGDKQIALASFLIRKLQQRGRANLTLEFFASFKKQSLPNPAELCDNLLLWIAGRTDGRVGTRVFATFNKDKPSLLAEIGAVDAADGLWALEALEKEARKVGGGGIFCLPFALGLAASRRIAASAPFVAICIFCSEVCKP
jgi:hypothetical protein